MAAFNPITRILGYLKEEAQGRRPFEDEDPPQWWLREATDLTRLLVINVW